MEAADGTPLKKSLERSLRKEKLRALALIAPLLIFVLVTFVSGADGGANLDVYIPVPLIILALLMNPLIKLAPAAV